MKLADRKHITFILLGSREWVSLAGGVRLFASVCSDSLPNASSMLAGVISA